CSRGMNTVMKDVW
nr:immunoglobulin heavy chain junction region [Macaca mulatta]